MNRRDLLRGAAALSVYPPSIRAAGAKPNVLFLMCDQQRFDTIAALGNQHIYTPNMDRLVRRGLTFTNAYSTCPVCVPARYTIRTGCEPPTTGIFENGRARPVPGQAATMTGRCGPYLAATMRSLGYRTFGIGKFHTQPWNEDLGYDVYLQSQEMYGSPEHRRGDAFASWRGRSSSSPPTTSVRISASYRSSARTRRLRRPFPSTACTIRTACPTRCVAASKTTTWTSRSRS